MILSTLAIVSVGFTGATFDATDYSPDYVTGITQVYAEADNGTELFIPVYSLPECVEEDGIGDPCVWIASKHGNGQGQSYVQLGEGDARIFADVSPWAAEILVSGAGVQVQGAEVQTVDTLEVVREGVPVQAVPEDVFPAVPEDVPVQAIHPVEAGVVGSVATPENVQDVPEATGFDGVFTR